MQRTCENIYENETTPVYSDHIWWEFYLLPWRWHILSIPLNAGRGISAETCELDDVFPPDDLCSGPYTQFVIYIPYIIATILVIKKSLF